jgi:enoyl-CoA hydratase/carnithine racemase
MMMQADIKEMLTSDYYKASTQDKIAPWEVISRAKLPLIAAVNGMAFGVVPHQ